MAGKQVEIFVLTETKIKTSKQRDIKDKLGIEWSIHTNIGQMEDIVGDSIWMGWNPMIWKGVIESESQQHIHGHFINQGRLDISVTVVYGSNKKPEREELWDELAKNGGIVGEAPWIVMEDFNDICLQEERDGQGDFDEDGTRQFIEAVDNAELRELATMGGFYTWNNCSRGRSLVRSEIDRMLVSETWMEKLPMAMVELFRGGMSDHVALIARLCALAANREWRPFRAFNSWFDLQEVVCP